MEYVPGEALTDHCDQEHLTVEERLRLFIRVCQGVQHAHQKGILHRDLKPSNLLVAEVEGQPLPKVIDFGIAKALDEPLTEKAGLTGLRAIGTPEYMSPEALAAGGDLDTRTDVYSLGVVLYELLAGVLPHEPRRPGSGSPFESASTRPAAARPSTRVSSLDGATGRQVAERRGLTTSVLAKRVRGDLDWIVMKAIADEPDRRYPSAADLAADVERHLKHEPVTATPPSLRYRAGKFVRRHRAGVAAAALVALTLVLGIAGTSLGLVRARQAEKDARAQAEAARQLSDFLTEVFDVSDPGVSRGNAVTARELLDRAAARIATQLENQPLVRARMMQTLGRVYGQLGLYEQSESLLDSALSLRREALGDRNPEVAQSLVELGVVYTEEGRLEEAAAAIREGPDIQRDRLEPDAPEIATALYRLGWVLLRQGLYEQAEERLQRALDIAERVHGPASTEVARINSSLAGSYTSRGLLAEAEPLLRKALSIHEATVGRKHGDTASAHYNLAATVFGLGRPDEAIQMTREILATREAVLGPSHNLVGQTLSNLGYMLFFVGRYDEARPYLERAVELARSDAAVKSGATASSNTNLGLVYWKLGRLDEAIPLFQEAMRIQDEIMEPTHLERAATILGLANVYRDQSRYEEAEVLYKQALEIRENALPPGHWSLKAVLEEYAELLRRTGRDKEAQSLEVRIVAKGE